MEGGEAEAASRRRSRVVVVGGGIGGSLLARSIQKYANVTLIDSKEYFEIPWANLRSKVEPSAAENSLINHTDYLTHGAVIAESAVNVTEKEVLTAEGHKVPYDYLVIATGHTMPYPKSRTGRLEQFLEDNTKIRNAGSILIIGGGPSGVELAGEIAVDHPTKKVTLVHNGPRLLEFIGRKAAHKALDWLKSKKVEVLLGQSVDLRSLSEENKEYKTSAGVSIKADCHFLCVDRPLGSSWLQKSILSESMNSSGRVIVDEHLRVAGHKSVFAIGDITDIPELKQGMIAQKHAMVVAKNLKLLMKGAKDSKLTKYRPTVAVAMVSLGRKNAVAQLPLLTMLGSIPGKFKSKDLFVTKTRKQMGLHDRCSKRAEVSPSKSLATSDEISLRNGIFPSKSSDNSDEISLRNGMLYEMSVEH